MSSVNSIDSSALNAPPPESSSSSKDDVKKRGRRGKGSKQHQAEKFRTRKNVDFDRELQAKIENLKISLGYTPQELFGSRSVTSIIRPQILFLLDSSCFGYVCDFSAEILHSACKLSPSPDTDEQAAISYDAETLMWVTAIQIEAKIFAARTGSQYHNDPSEHKMLRVQRANLLFPDALTPLAILFDQIGRFTFNDQIFIPHSETVFAYDCLIRPDNAARQIVPSLQVFDPPGVQTELRNHIGQRMYARIVENADQATLIASGIATLDNNVLTLTPQFIREPHLFPVWIGNIEFVPGVVPPAPPTIEQIANRYAELKGRVSKKLNNAFVDIQLSSGKGCESQITYRKVDTGDLYLAWSPRPIRADSLEMGAILGLGLAQNNWPLTSQDSAAVMATIDVSAGLRCVANVLTKKIR